MEKQQDYPKDEQARQQLKKKLADRWWRLNNLYWITNEKGKPIKFKPNVAQTAFYYALWYLNVILKARQLGFTTFIQILILDACLFNSNQRAGVIAHTKDDAEIIFRDKIKFAYDHLPDWLKAEIPASSDKVNELKFGNNSSIRVGTSMRSGTLQWLHVSELGKIAKKYPQKAKEIKTGAFNTVHEGQFIFVESTAEGRQGLFFDIVQKARRLADEGRKPNKLEFKFHFFPWWEDSRYVSDDMAEMTKADKKYFKSLEDEHDIALTDEQKNWYVGKSRQMEEGDGQDETKQSGDMKQEYPSVPDEAFEVQIKGAYYGDQIAALRKQGRITTVPYEPSLPVNTFWDLGRNDKTCIWFHQRVGLENRFFDYYENNGEGIPHYAKVLKDRGYTYDEHYLPHDAEVKEFSRGDQKSRKEVLEDFHVGSIVVVERIPDVLDGIEMTRNVLPSCWFDKIACDEGLKGLENYRKQWDEKLGAYKSRPLHDWASNPADAFRQFSQGYRAQTYQYQRRDSDSWRT